MNAADQEAVPCAIAAEATEPTQVIEAPPPRKRRAPRPYVPCSRSFPVARGPRMAGAAEVWAHLRDRLLAARVEEFWMLALDVRHRITYEVMAARGSLTGVEVNPRDIFRALIEHGAAGVVFSHNHPSGDPAPSRADIDLTARLRDVGEICGIPVLDHIIIAAGGFVSLAERNWR